MADLSSIERRKLERLLRMGGGYVLDFSDRTFSEFFEEHTRRDIDAAVYRGRGTSKANRLRGFWAAEGNNLVGKVIQALILYGQAENCLGDEPGLTELTDECWKIASRMMRDTPVAELDALTATVGAVGNGFVVIHGKTARFACRRAVHKSIDRPLAVLLCHSFWSVAGSLPIGSRTFVR